MTESPRSRFRLPHWGWFLLATVILVVGFVGLSVWLPYHREQQVVQKIEGWGGSVGTETGGPNWLRRLIGEDRMKGFKVYERVESVVNLFPTEVTDADLAQLRRLTNLKFLGFYDPAITDVGLAHLNGLTNLQSIGLDRAAVTDKGLAQLVGLTNLEVLSLNDTMVTDAGLAHLSGLAGLRHVYLERTAVTDNGIKVLQLALPDCEIYH